MESPLRRCARESIRFARIHRRACRNNVLSAKTERERLVWLDRLRDHVENLTAWRRYIRNVATR